MVVGLGFGVSGVEAATDVKFVDGKATLKGTVYRHPGDVYIISATEDSQYLIDCSHPGTYNKGDLLQCENVQTNTERQGHFTLKKGEEKVIRVRHSFPWSFQGKDYEVEEKFVSSYEFTIVEYKKSDKGQNETQNDKKETAPVIKLTDGLWESGPEFISNYDDIDYYKMSYESDTTFIFDIDMPQRCLSFYIKSPISLGAGKDDIPYKKYGKDYIKTNMYFSPTGSGDFHLVFERSSKCWTSMGDNDFFELPYSIKVSEHKKDDFGRNEPENDSIETAEDVKFINGIWRNDEDLLSHVRDVDYFNIPYAVGDRFKVYVYNGGDAGINFSLDGNSMWSHYVSPGSERLSYQFEPTGSGKFEIEVRKSKAGELINIPYLITVQKFRNGQQQKIPSFVFKDMFMTNLNDQNFYQAAISMYTQGLIQGYDDNTFRPNNSINRAEFTKIVTSGRFSDEIENCDQEKYGFFDTANTWMAPYVCVAKKNNILNGYDDGSFQPGNTIRLSEALKIIYMLKPRESYIVWSEPEPLKEGEAWYEPFYNFALTGRDLTNVPEDPSKELTRGEAIQLFYNTQMRLSISD